ncbi:hypothetical protein ZIOFF_044991 [Zingiber officinale]|uniref:Uncharacterized protein n=1 Tax=Zingiber officinale TaxID=94328 RepID=A0A8J5FXS8_ZINOF|nr:hypothetical protein ZIOFF_044991 [Zingiber officinale]
MPTTLEFGSLWHTIVLGTGDLRTFPKRHKVVTWTKVCSALVQLIEVRPSFLECLFRYFEGEWRY